MKFSNEWSRRHFLAVSSATAAQAAASLKGPLQTAPSAASATAAAQRNIQEAARLMPPPEIISGGIRAPHALHDRPPAALPPHRRRLRHPQRRRVLQPPALRALLHHPDRDFRVDASDLPEFSLYLPGHGGNLKLGFIALARQTPAAPRRSGPQSPTRSSPATGPAA